MTPPVRYSPAEGSEASTTPQNGLKRSRVYAATVAEDEHAAITEATRQAGFPRPSVAARAILMAFARSAEVRDAVARWVRTHPEVL